jgi:TRAP-type C4-dicarboxylate transport system permease small subunit
MTDQTTTIEDSGVLAKLAQITIGLACMALVGVAVVEGWQVFARYVLNSSPSWTEPVALLLMSTAMMCGAAIGVRGNRHFGFFMLAEHGPQSIRRAVLFLPPAMAIAVGVIFVFAGAHLVSESWDFPMAGAPLPQGTVYLPITLGGALIALFAIERVLPLLKPTAQAMPQR